MVVLMGTNEFHAGCNPFRGGGERNPPSHQVGGDLNARETRISSTWPDTDLTLQQRYRLPKGQAGKLVFNTPFIE